MRHSPRHVHAVPVTVVTPLEQFCVPTVVVAAVDVVVVLVVVVVVVVAGQASVHGQP